MLNFTILFVLYRKRVCRVFTDHQLHVTVYWTSYYVRQINERSLYWLHSWVL